VSPEDGFAVLAGAEATSSNLTLPARRLAASPHRHITRAAPRSYNKGL